MIDRRRFIGGVAGSLLAVPVITGAQQATKLRRIGYLSAPTRASVEQGLQAFLQALHDLGWIEGQNLVIEYRWADGQIERLPSLAAELVAQKVDLIVAPAGTAALAAKKATSSIPVVMIFPADPVGLGLVASMRRPGGNVTGTTSTPSPEIFGKQLQLLKEAVPRATRVAILVNPVDLAFGSQLREVETAAQSIGIRIQRVEARGPEEFESAFAAMTGERAAALLVANDTTFLVNRAKVAELALKSRLPTMNYYREMVEAGGFMAYAVNMAGFTPRAAVYVDKILKGAKTADLPVEQPTKFELVINMKTAKALAITIPPSLLARADELIQ
jgi:putative tryptophan/tyrosine transport system substrate-binding protein